MRIKFVPETNNKNAYRDMLLLVRLALQCLNESIYFVVELSQAMSDIL